MKCEHTDYDDYFEQCLDCGLSGEQIHAAECPLDSQVTEDGQCENCGTLTAVSVHGNLPGTCSREFAS